MLIKIHHFSFLTQPSFCFSLTCSVYSITRFTHLHIYSLYSLTLLFLLILLIYSFYSLAPLTHLLLLFLLILFIYSRTIPGHDGYNMALPGPLVKRFITPPITSLYAPQNTTSRTKTIYYNPFAPPPTPSDILSHTCVPPNI